MTKMRVMRPWEGSLDCAQILPDGARCRQREIEGMEFCFRHVPAELLEEAEEITGWRRCTKEGGCNQVAVTATVPPLCKNHGGNRGSTRSKFAAASLVSDRQADRLVAILAEHGDRLLNPDPIGNPLEELMDLAAEIKAFKEVMRQVTAYLVSRERVRSAHDKVGEQLRAEILLYERAQERLADVLVKISKMGIEQLMARLEAEQVRMLERAFAKALQSSGASLEGQEHARQVLRGELVPAKAS
jgi:hypothetical protein